MGIVVAAFFVSGFLGGCAAELPAHVIVAEPIHAEGSVSRRPASVVPVSDLVVESGKAEDGNFYARIIDKKNSVICYSVTPSAGQGTPSMSCIKR